MSLEIYKVIHLIGLAMTLLALGIGIGAAWSAPLEKSLRRVIFPLHGVGVLLLLVTGFGMLARMGIMWPLPGWIYVKLIVWLVLVIWLSLIARQKVSGLMMKLGVPLLATALAVWAALFMR